MLNWLYSNTDKFTGFDDSGDYKATIWKKATWGKECWLAHAQRDDCTMVEHVTSTKEEAMNLCERVVQGIPLTGNFTTFLSGVRWEYGPTISKIYGESTYECSKDGYPVAFIKYRGKGVYEIRELTANGGQYLGNTKALTEAKTFVENWLRPSIMREFLIQ